MYVYYGFYQYMWCVVHNLHIIIKYTVLFIAASMQPTDSHRRLLLIWTKPWDSQPANQSWFDKNNALNCIPICSFPSKFIIIISFMWSLELLNCSSFIEIILPLFLIEKLSKIFLIAIIVNPWILWIEIVRKRRWFTVGGKVIYILSLCYCCCCYF